MLHRSLSRKISYGSIGKLGLSAGEGDYIAVPDQIDFEFRKSGAAYTAYADGKLLTKTTLGPGPLILFFVIRSKEAFSARIKMTGSG